MRTRFIGLGLIVLGVAWAGLAQAVPQALTEQGRLLDATGNPVTTSVTITFSIYTTPTGGTAPWTEKQTVTPDAGFFSAELGSVTALPTNLFDGQPKYLGIQIKT